MVHPLFSILINRPELVVDHAAGYAALVREEASGFGVELLQRGIAWGVAVMSLTVFLVLAGVAVMLGVLEDRFHWVLLAAPGVALAVAIVAWVKAREPLSDDHFAQLRTQADADALALRRAGARR